MGFRAREGDDLSGEGRGAGGHAPGQRWLVDARDEPPAFGGGHKEPRCWGKISGARAKGFPLGCVGACVREGAVCNAGAGVMPKAHCRSMWIQGALGLKYCITDVSGQKKTSCAIYNLNHRECL
ncbi:hypothetical protein MHYP_G00025430 [Metynnis hypsauchen]